MASRALGVDDIDIICEHREKMFRDAGRDENTLAGMTSAFRKWLKPRLLDKRYFGFFLVENDAVVAGIGLMEIDWPPHPSHPMQSSRGYVLNLYVEAPHRKKGMGKILMRMAEEEFARRDLQFAILHSTQMGRPLYENMGWGPTTEMSKILR